jgi:hypothetical protein
MERAIARANAGAASRAAWRRCRSGPGGVAAFPGGAILGTLPIAGGLKGRSYRARRTPWTDFERHFHPGRVCVYAWAMYRRGRVVLAQRRNEGAIGRGALIMERGELLN